MRGKPAAVYTETLPGSHATDEARGIIILLNGAAGEELYMFKKVSVRYLVKREERTLEAINERDSSPTPICRSSRPNVQDDFGMGPKEVWKRASKLTERGVDQSACRLHVVTNVNGALSILQAFWVLLPSYAIRLEKLPVADWPLIFDIVSFASSPMLYFVAMLCLL
ncbi:hypothetical protein LTR49_022505 [Elasticomyces elasticus]|nr:hypothetical protein LTR49_022505 [Elasticomyces elasticus]